MAEGDRLTRQELTWLLTQEARSAAETLRKGVAVLSHTPTQVALSEERSPAPLDLETSLHVLDDATKLLASLHVGSTRGRRGRIDIAAMLCELAPSAKVRLEPGSGTEVSGDETELRRMMQVMLAHSSGGNSRQGNDVPEVSIERERDDVRVSVTLGPDIAAAASTERAWLSRMAMRYGGRLELQGSQECLYLPAEGAIEKSEVAQLRKELEEAQRQGEAYARELAAVFAAGDGADPTMVSSVPSSSSPPSADAIIPASALAMSTAAELRDISTGLAKDADGLKERHADAPLIADALHRRIHQINELVSDLNRLAKVPVDELPSLLDLTAVINEAIDRAQPRASRLGIQVETPMKSSVTALVSKSAVRALVQSMLEHAMAASPKGSTVRAEFMVADKSVSLVVDDAGAAIPAGSRDALILRSIDPTSIGRPTGISLFCASTIVGHLNGMLTLTDSPSGGCRTMAYFQTL